ncbi:MAG: Do family serine endopeptidase [Gemmatimonadaceae bacterium]|nr:Do family serine endopeptidase [Gemmatimonadaceae bacterium]
MTSVSSRAKLLGAVAIAFACGLVFAAGFDLTRFGFAQGKANTSVRQASLTPAPASVAELNNSFVGISEKVTPAVVSISALRTEQPRQRPNVQRRQGQPPGIEDFFQQFGPQQQQQPQASSGSGFIVTADGYVLTNNHVIDGMDRIKVTLTDQREFTAKVVGKDPQTDVAVLKIDASNLPTTPLGDDAALRVGEWVLAIGNPLGLDHTVTAGIVSAKQRGQLDIGVNSDRYAISDFIQTDAAINPGNSGGPLVNIRGEVIGINSAIATRTGYYQGYGFAIPITLARDVMDDLIKNGRVRRAVIGVGIAEVTPSTARAAGLSNIAGAVVGSYTTEDSPAKRAGLEPGDVIVKADGKPVDRVGTLQRIIRAHEPGESVELEVMRFGDRKTIRVRLIEAEPEARALAASQNESEEDPSSRNSTRTGTWASPALGVTVEPLSEAFVRENKIPADYRQGVRVVDGEPWARRSYFKADGSEIITAVLFPRPRRSVTSAEQLKTILSAVKDGDPVSVLIYDAQTSSTRVVTLTVGEQ